MRLLDLKYLLAYLTPISCWISLTYSGLWSFTTLIFLFIFLPIAEQIFKGTSENLSAKAEEKKLNSSFFDWLLYLNLPILYYLIYIYLSGINFGMAAIDLIGNTLAIGLIIGSVGINVAHEIGHRHQWYNQYISRALLLPALYMHFNIEHNLGHHKWVATPKDPASSREGESFYRFWPRTVIQSFRSAWRIEKEIQKKKGRNPFGIKNRMIQYTVIQIGALVFIGVYYGPFQVFMAILAAIIGFTLLEAVNYIEHYGLTRALLPSGKYGPVEARHSWNSNHDLGRIMLYELTRHSDHHYKTTRKYQVLRHFDESPQLPMGYPGSIILATIPPLWFRIMNTHLAKARQST